jgi:hypothetical protein
MMTRCSPTPTAQQHVISGNLAVYTGFEWIHDNDRYTGWVLGGGRVNIWWSPTFIHPLNVDVADTQRGLEILRVWLLDKGLSASISVIQSGDREDQ